ncbi:LamG domain-containing protein [Nonomuraea gerenzanensis]|uniref:LamG domain-containing protein n=1 Tax=Nonomuraea gerenzanensis TaxID=93944 RepID=UPI001CD93429|nr:LamG domain-containing protein [Nonomuraea gerenzanensis]
MSDAIQVDGGALTIGSNLVWEEYFDGLIDEVRIYDRAQTAQQIQGSGASRPRALNARRRPRRSGRWRPWSGPWSAAPPGR